MIVDERITAYMNSLSVEETPFLEELERTALENRVPIIRKETQSFLKMLVQLKRPVQILEIGTAVGFSALLMRILPVKLPPLRTMGRGFPLPGRIFVRREKRSRLRCFQEMQWNC